MTIDEAIKELRHPLKQRECDKLLSFLDAIDMAISALRAQQEAEKNEPLTAEELDICRKSNVPIYVVAKCGPITCSGWALAGMRNALLQDFTSTVLWYETYGIEWTAYSRPPESK